MRGPRRGRGKRVEAARRQKQEVRQLKLHVILAMRAHCRRVAQREEILGAVGARTRPKWRRQKSREDKMQGEDAGAGRMGAHAGDSVGRLR